MSETKYSHNLPPFNELLVRDDMVYHAVGSDIVALDGVAEHGLASHDAQVELTGEANSNSPRELAKNGNDLISVALSPQAGRPNAAFMNYIEHSPVTFAVVVPPHDLTQPTSRGFYDEAFITHAHRASIAGIVLEAATMDRPLTSLPIVQGNVSADVVASKARAVLGHITRQYAARVGESEAELEGLLADIGHITTNSLLMSFGMISDVDREKIGAIDAFLQQQLATGLAAKYGSPDVTVLQVVQDKFGDKPVYINDHSAGIQLYDEPEFFKTLDVYETIGFDRYDGTPGRPSAAKLRKLIGAVSTQGEARG